MCYEPKSHTLLESQHKPTTRVLSPKTKTMSHSPSHGRFVCLYRRLWLWFFKTFPHNNLASVFANGKTSQFEKNYCVGGSSVSGKIDFHEIVFWNTVPVSLKRLPVIAIQLSSSAHLAVAHRSVFRCMSHKRFLCLSESTRILGLI